MQNLKNLRLEGNLLEKIPTEALMGLSSLEALWDKVHILFCSEQIIFIKYIGSRKQKEKPQQQKNI